MMIFVEIEFVCSVNIESIVDIDMKDVVGSPKLIKSAAFKNFLLDLTKISPEKFFVNFLTNLYTSKLNAKLNLFISSCKGFKIEKGFGKFFE